MRQVATTREYPRNASAQVAQPRNLRLSARDSLIFAEALRADKPNEALRLAMARRVVLGD